MKNKICAIIPCRKGSKRLPNKNKKIFIDRPLICWTIEELLKCRFIDEIVISTDDSDIINITLKYKNPKLKIVHRPKNLAKDKTLIWEVIKHAFQGEPQNTIILCCQVTNPLKLYTDIEKSYQLFIDGNEQFSVVGAYYEFPMRYIKLNGSIFIQRLSTIIHTKSFINQGTILYLMPKERSVDIDLQSDFDLAERYMRLRLNSD